MECCRQSATATLPGKWMSVWPYTRIVVLKFEVSSKARSSASPASARETALLAPACLLTGSQQSKQK